MRTHRFTTQDGVRLHAAEHAPDAPGLPIVALPGLTRNSKDFAPLADCLPGQRIIALDLRGRGQSGWASDAQSYRAPQEAADTLALLAQLGVKRAIFLGTSRGGIVSLIIHAMARELMAGLILNDIGPRLEPEGLLRIRAYVGPTRPLASWQEAAVALQHTSPGLEGLDAAQWLAFAQRIFRATPDGILPDYDPALASTFPAAEEIRAGLPEMWEAYAALGPRLPLAVLRGENSDLLSRETVARMQAITPQLHAAEIARRAHVPFLDEPESLAAIRRVIAAAAP